MRFSNKWRCVLFLVPSSLYTYLFRCFWVKTILYICCVCVVVSLFSLLLFRIISSKKLNTIVSLLFASLLLFTLCYRVCTLRVWYLYAIQVKISGLFDCVVWCCVVLHYAGLEMLLIFRVVFFSCFCFFFVWFFFLYFYNCKRCVCGYGWFFILSLSSFRWFFSSGPILYFLLLCAEPYLVCV